CSHRAPSNPPYGYPSSADPADALQISGRLLCRCCPSRLPYARNLLQLSSVQKRPERHHPLLLCSFYISSLYRKTWTLKPSSSIVLKTPLYLRTVSFID